MTTDRDDFLPLQRNYENLTVFKIARCIHAITYHFASTYLPHGDRTRDQMIQGARSGKQNIAEGSVDGATSVEMEIRLMNVARGSMQELKTDYEDYLLHHSLQHWSKDDPRVRQVRQFTKRHNEPEIYIEKIKERSPETIANIVLTMIHQYDYMMVRLIESIKQRFLEQGGMKEALYRARVKHRGSLSAQNTQKTPSSPSSPSFPSSPRKNDDKN